MAGPAAGARSSTCRWRQEVAGCRSGRAAMSPSTRQSQSRPTAPFLSVASRCEHPSSSREAALGFALSLLPAITAAQAGTAELLQQARQLYERLEIERALTILRQVVSPGWPLEVTNAQRVEAYKYLGAALVL